MMKPPKIIYLTKPYPGAGDCVWCSPYHDTLDDTERPEPVQYIRADHVLDVLRESEKVKKLIDYLEKEDE